VAYATICLSGHDGSQMRDIAQEAAERLGFTLVEEEIVMRAAAEAGVKPAVVADVERRRSFMDRALGAMSVTDHSGFTGTSSPAPDPFLDEDLRNLIRAAIEETAARGEVVIVAHAASHALGVRPDVLRVLVTASPDVRRARVADERGLSEKDAARAVATSDAARADYIKRFYGMKSELPEHYDLVVSTDKLSVDEAAAIVVLAAGR
jgi:cytidylate kinase